MPQIQYSEKYYDDIYEYRRAGGSQSGQSKRSHREREACRALAGSRSGASGVVVAADGCAWAWLAGATESGSFSCAGTSSSRRTLRSSSPRTGCSRR